ncbi:MAG: chromosome partitioning protein ParB, partial [Ethanoligenens sp.]
ATILMCDTNLHQRETSLPRERAFAYKMKLEAMKHQGARTDLTSGPMVQKSRKYSVEVLADQTGESYKQVQRYIRLTELVPPLLTMVDEGSVAFRPAVELSYLKKEEQQTLLDVMESEQVAPSVSQAQRLKKFSQDSKLDRNSMEAIMTEEKPEVEKLTIRGDKLRKTFSGLFPRDATPQQMEDTIVKALTHYQKFQQQNRQQHKTHARDMAR